MRQASYHDREKSVDLKLKDNAHWYLTFSGISNLAYSIACRYLLPIYAGMDCFFALSTLFENVLSYQYLLMSLTCWNCLSCCFWDTYVGIKLYSCWHLVFDKRYQQNCIFLIILSHDSYFLYSLCQLTI